MFKRKAMEKLVFWKEHKNKQAMLVDGARQVGKTSLVEEFGRTNYEHMVEINFIDMPDARRAADNAQNADDLFLAISAYAQDEIIPGKTLIFLDEIQTCRDVVTMIKFLVSRYDDYDFVLSGSLLGVEAKSVESVPVGFLDSITMYPMDFEEYCWANKVPGNVWNEVRLAHKEKRSVNEAVHRRMTDLFHDYLLVGGMPDAVSVFWSSTIFNHCVRVSRQSSIGIVRIFRSMQRISRKRGISAVFSI